MITPLDLPAFSTGRRVAAVMTHTQQTQPEASPIFLSLAASVSILWRSCARPTHALLAQRECSAGPEVGTIITIGFWKIPLLVRLIPLATQSSFPMGGLKPSSKSIGIPLVIVSDGVTRVRQPECASVLCQWN